MQTMFVAARTALAMLFLFYASWSDFKTREVSNVVWILFAPLAFALSFSEIYIFEFMKLPFYALSFGLTAVFSIMLFYAGGFGGADAKALMCLALVLPFYPGPVPKSFAGSLSPISEYFFPMTVFSNSVLMAAATAIYMILRNIWWGRRAGEKFFEGGQEHEGFGSKLLVLMTGQKVPLDRLKQKWHLYPLEDVEEIDNRLKRKLVVLPRDEARDAIVERLESAVQAGRIRNSVWATPGLPMLIFITAGLIIALLLGDIVWIGVSALLG